MTDFTLKTRHVNSKVLLAEVTKFVDEIITSFNVMWSSGSQRDVILEVLDEHMEDIMDENKIEQYEVMCDDRNNVAGSNEVHLDIKYRQRNCFNVTELKYTINE